MISLVGWMLVHAAWQGGLIGAAVALILWLARRANASTRYALALVGLALTVVAPIATAVTYNRAVRGEASANAVAPPVVHTRKGSAADVAMVVARSDAPLRRASLASFARRIDIALPWLVAVWMLGVAMLSIRVLAGVMTVRRLARRGVSAADARIRAVGNLVAERLRIRAAVRVLQSTEIDVPMVVGWLKPAVLVPVSLLASASPGQLEMLLAHELSHIRRYDTIVNLAQRIVETLLFFHPAVWWISARVRDERENCCDDLAIAVSGTDRPAYGAMLLLLEESRGTSALAVAATGGSLLRRVRRIVLGPPTPVDLGGSWFAGVATMLTALFAFVPSGAPATSARLEHATAPAALIVRSPEPAPPPAVQHLSRSTPMQRPSKSLLAGVAALSIAAATVSAQAIPNFSGRWLVVADSESSATGWTNTPADSLLGQSAIIEQSDRTLTFTRGDARLTFQIEPSDGAASVRVKGPVSLGFHGIELTLDTTAGTPRVRAEWAGGAIDVSLPTSASDALRLGTMTLSLDPSGDLIVLTDIPAEGGHSGKRVFSRLRRA